MTPPWTQERYPKTWWTRLDDGRILCDGCPLACALREGQTGLCFVRVRADDLLIERDWYELGAWQPVGRSSDYVAENNLRLVGLRAQSFSQGLRETSFPWRRPPLSPLRPESSA